MPHHSDVPGFNLGATGRFPEGKIHASDEGELSFAVGAKEGNVIVEFGKPVAWIGLPPQLARDFADSLTKHADALEPESSIAARIGAAARKLGEGKGVY